MTTPTDPIPAAPAPAPEELRAALRMVLLAADYAASDRYYATGHRPDGAPEAEELRRLIDLVAANVDTLAGTPARIVELEAALAPFAEVSRRLANRTFGGFRYVDDNLRPGLLTEEAFRRAAEALAAGEGGTR